MLQRAEHAEDEAVPLSRLRAKAGGAKSLRVVILDSCRSNPFAARLAREAGAKRAIWRGLPAPALLEGDELIAYATRETMSRTMAMASTAPSPPRSCSICRSQGSSPFPVRQGARQRASRDRPRANAHHLWRSRRRLFLFPGAAAQGERRTAAAALRGRGSLADLRDTGSEAELEAFVKRFGETVFGDFARARLAEIKRTKIASARPVVQAPKPALLQPQLCDMRTGRSASSAPSPGIRAMSIRLPFPQTAARLRAGAPTRRSSFGMRRAAGSFAPSPGIRALLCGCLFPGWPHACGASWQDAQALGCGERPGAAHLHRAYVQCQFGSLFP